MAVLSNGRRCPNAAIPSSIYCGLPSHQALTRFETSQVAVLANVSEPEIAILADPDADRGRVDEIVARASATFVEDEQEREAAPPAGPVGEDDSSSSQAAGEEPSSPPPTGETSEALAAEEAE